jgi:hypothetical protein
MHKLTIGLVFPVVAGVAVAAGCSSNPQNPGGTTQAASKLFRPGRGFVPTVQTAAQLAADRANVLSTGTLQYFGGKVIPRAQVYNVYWGNAGSYKTQLDTFIKTLVPSTYVAGLDEYNTNTQTISNGNFVKSIIDTAVSAGGTVDDTQIRTELDRLVSSGTIPPPDANTLVLFFFPNGTNVTATDAGTSCLDFCGYHETYVNGSHEFYYGVLPDPATCGASCDNQNGDYFADLTSVTTHEISEAVTDAEVGLAIQASFTSGVYPVFPNAWTSASGEIGDLCAWQNATFAGYNVQLEWSNAANGCIVPNGVTTDGGVDGGGDGGTDSSAPMNLVVNGGFENGSTGWTFHEKSLAVQTQIVHSGTSALRLGKLIPYTRYAIATQPITLPATGTSTLSFWAYYTCGANDTVPAEYQQVRIQDSSGANLKTIFRQCKNDQTWEQTTVDLSKYNGTTITLQFAGKDDLAADPDPWYLDDVSVTNK